MASLPLNSHQASENWQDCQKGKNAEEDQHPNAHTFLVFLIFFVLLNAVSIFAYTFFCFRRDIDATHTAMFV